MTDEDVKQSYGVKEVLWKAGASATQGHAVLTAKGGTQALVIPPEELEATIMILQMAHVQHLMIQGRM